MKETLETEYLKIWLEEDILHCVFVNGLEMDLPVAKKCVADRLTFSGGKSYLCLIDMKGMRSVTKDAREYMAKEGSACITASALMVGSALSRMIGNIFITINKPAVPVRLFTDKEEAKKWLMNLHDFQ